MAYAVTSVTSLCVGIFILILFFFSSYHHKMIGLQSIQILQFLYFIRMTIDQKHSSVLNAMNLLKYTAFGGYSNFEVLFGTNSKGIISLTNMTVNQEFVYVGLFKYFFLNVNWSLISLIIVLVFYAIVFARKCYQRNKYIRNRNLENKDRYIMLRRTCQWVYDHFTFPYVMLFSFIVFFCTILSLKSVDKPTSSPLHNSA